METLLTVFMTLFCSGLAFFVWDKWKTWNEAMEELARLRHQANTLPGELARQAVENSRDLLQGKEEKITSLTKRIEQLTAELKAERARADADQKKFYDLGLRIAFILAADARYHDFDPDNLTFQNGTGEVFHPISLKKAVKDYAQHD